MTAPGRGQAVEPRQAGIRVGGNIEHGEIVVDEAIGQTAKRECREYELALGRGTGNIHPGNVAACGTDERQDRLSNGNTECDDQCEMSEFGNHRKAVTGKR